MKEISIPIAAEGYPFIFFSAFVTLIAGLVEIPLAALCGILITCFVTYFFRDPERVVADDDSAIISPADGKIIFVEKIFDDRFIRQEVFKISIFMNIFNVHVNRFPFSGTVEKISFAPGRFYSADTDRGALHNEHCAMIVQTDSGIKYGVVQVAGLIARRIVCWAEKKDRLITGERYGLIRFGSRVDLYLPPDVEITIRKGQKVRAGETTVARFRQVSHSI